MSQTIDVGPYRVTAYSPPPKGFDPLSAAESELRAYGFCRPGQRAPIQAQKAWERAVRRITRYRIPRFTPSPWRRRSLRIPTKRAGGGQSYILQGISPDWSGWSVNTFDEDGTFVNLILGEWTVPNPYVSSATSYSQLSGITVGASQWVGMWDGAHNTAFGGNIFQAGVMLEASIVPSLFGPQPLTTNISTWWEWFPAISVGIDFPAAAGDTIYWQISLLINQIPSGTLSDQPATSGNIFIQSANSGDTSMFDVSAPLDPNGNQIESQPQTGLWIMEAPEVGTQPPMEFQMAGYGAAYCDECLAVSYNADTGAGGIWWPGTDPSGGISLVQNNIVKSSVTLETNTLLKFLSGPPGSVD
jgi:hypothetical protein